MYRIRYRFRPRLRLLHLPHLPYPSHLSHYLWLLNHLVGWKSKHAVAGVSTDVKGAERTIDSVEEMTIPKKRTTVRRLAVFAAAVAAAAAAATEHWGLEVQGGPEALQSGLAVACLQGWHLEGTTEHSAVQLDGEVAAR